MMNLVSYARPVGLISDREGRLDFDVQVHIPNRGKLINHLVKSLTPGIHEVLNDPLRGLPAVSRRDVSDAIREFLIQGTDEAYVAKTLIGLLQNGAIQDGLTEEASDDDYMRIMVETMVAANSVETPEVAVVNSYRLMFMKMIERGAYVEDRAFMADITIRRVEPVTNPDDPEVEVTLMGETLRTPEEVARAFGKCKVTVH